MIRPDFREIKHSELYHYGVSKRNGASGPGSGRYPLGSGSEPFQMMNLSEKEKKKISKEYARVNLKAQESYAREYDSLAKKALDRTNEYLEREGQSKFDKKQRKKYGSNYKTKDNYQKELFDFINGRLAEEHARSIKEYLEHDKYFQKAKEISERYKMVEWDQLAKDTLSYEREIYDIARKIDGR